MFDPGNPEYLGPEGGHSENRRLFGVVLWATFQVLFFLSYLILFFLLSMTFYLRWSWSLSSWTSASASLTTPSPRSLNRRKSCGSSPGRRSVCTVLYCTILCCPLLCTVLHYDVLYCAILCCPLLCTVLYYSTLYCTVLYCSDLDEIHHWLLHAAALQPDLVRAGRPGETVLLSQAGRQWGPHYGAGGTQRLGKPPGDVSRAASLRL